MKSFLTPDAAKVALVALIGALGSQAAFSQDVSGIQIYGNVDAAVSVVNTGGTSGALVRRLDSGIGGSSSLGFRGEESLGGALKAIFRLETQFDQDTGVSTAYAGNPSYVGTAPAPVIPFGFNRRAFVGLRSEYGTFTLGRDYTPTYWALHATDAFALSYWGNAQSSIDLTGTGAERSGRVSNAIFYESPTFSGFKARTVYSFGAESPGGVGNPPRDANVYVSAGAEYRIGKFMLVAGLDQLSLATLVGTPASFAPDTQKRTDYIIGARYDFEAYSLRAGYIKYDHPGVGSDGKQMWLGARAKVGPGTVIAQVQMMERLATTGAGPKANVFGLAYEYPFSRRTVVYASYGRTTNNSTGTFRVYSSAGAVSPSAPGADPEALSVGISHKF